MKNVKSLVVEEAGKPYNIRHRCFHFAKSIIEFEKKMEYERIHFSLFDQLLRSATSIGANVVEGGAGSTKKDFINFFQNCFKVSKRNQILALFDKRYISS